MLRIALLLLIAATLASCTSSADLALSDPLPIDGLYRSAGSVGDLGQLQLVVRKRTGSVRVFNAELTSDQLTVAPSDGRGTLGNQHLVLNFDIGQTDDYYFQGNVEQDSAGTVTGLTGTFIFPGQPEQLPVEFTWISTPPAEETP